MKKQLIIFSAVLLYLLTFTQCTGPDAALRFRFSAKPAPTINRELSRAKRSPYDSAEVCASKDQPSVVISSEPKHDDMFISAHPGGRIFYQYGQMVNDDMRRLIRQAMDEWENRVEYIQFVDITKMSPEQRPRRSSYHHIDAPGSDKPAEAYTTIGFLGAIGKVPLMMLNSKNASAHIIKHELGHMIGLCHEGQRTDALNYIKYRDPMIAHLKNLQPASFRENYELATIRYINNPKYNVLNYPFDYYSILMYDSYVYGYPDGKDLWTYMRKSDCKMTKPEEVSNITDTDVKKVKGLYAMKAVVRNQTEHWMYIRFYGTDNQFVHKAHVRDKASCFIDYDPSKEFPFSLNYYDPVGEGMDFTNVIITRGDIYSATDYGKEEFRGSLKFVKDAAGKGCIDFTVSQPRLNAENMIAGGSVSSGGGAGIQVYHPGVEEKRLFSSLNVRKNLDFSFRNGIPESNPSLYIYCTVAGFLQRNQRSQIPSYFPDAADRLNSVVNDIIDRDTYGDGDIVKVPIYFVMILDDVADENYARNVGKPGTGNRYSQQINYPTDNGTAVASIDPLNPSLSPLTTDAVPEPLNMTLFISATHLRDELRKR